LRRGPCLPLAQNPLTCQHEADLLFLCARSCGYCDRDGHSFLTLIIYYHLQLAEGDVHTVPYLKRTRFKVGNLKTKAA